MERVYIESTVPSYLTAKPTENLIATARQILTQRWWEEYKNNYELYVSDVVLLECQKGDPKAAERRIRVMRNIPVLDMTMECSALAEKIFKELQIPPKASDDSFHIAIACVHEVDYLLSWNFKHIVNASMIRKLRDILQKTPYRLPHICTPEELVP